MSEQVKIFDLGHWEHKIFQGFYEVGETVYNCSNRRSPVRKHGKAPHMLLELYSRWFEMAQAEADLIKLGFEKISDVLWRKE